MIVLSAATSIAGTLALRAEDVPLVRHVEVLRGGNQVEIQIESSASIVPQTNELGGPNRLLIDFVKARPGAQLRSQNVDRNEVKDLRVSLFSKDPPVTRIVVDLNGPQPYQVFPAGRTTIVKIGGTGVDISGAQASSGNILAANEAANPPPEPPKPSLEVAFRNGLLSINSYRASLSEVLFAVHQRTGAEIAIPAGAEQEKVVVNLGPAPAPDVLSQLLNGSKFNFVILSSPKNPGALDQVILTPRTDAPVQAQAAAPQPPPQPATNDDTNNADQENNPRFRMRGRPGLPPFRDPNPNVDEGQAPPPENDNGPN
ncbi:MAG: AMIN domain-containing protein [Candidatus Sulfotelmatobacter sp.]